MSEQKTTFAWLIERGQPEGIDPPVYYSTYAAKTKWTPDANLAVRFTSKADAEAFIEDRWGFISRAVEHGFVEHGLLDTTYHKRRVARRRAGDEGLRRLAQEGETPT